MAASEAAPFAKVGGLGDVVGALAKELKAKGLDIRIAIPAYRTAKEWITHNTQAELLWECEPERIRVGDMLCNAGISKAILNGSVVYLIESPMLFDREGIYGPNPAEGYKDNLERYALLCRGIMRLILEGDWKPDIIHANDWQTALIPVYLRQLRATDTPLARIGSLFTIHNLAYQGVFPLDKIGVTAIDTDVISAEQYEFYGKLNLMKTALFTADRLNTVSPAYRDETLAGGNAGAGLEDALLFRREHYRGILNGIDYQAWSPAEDSYLEYNYKGSWRRFKNANKKALIKECGFAAEEMDKPVAGLISRLVHQKGVDLVFEALDEIVRLGCKVVVLGAGDERFREQLQAKMNNFPEQIHCDLTFNEPLAHRIYAGADMILIPSRFEPCGLTQMIAIRYGTIPIASNVGGLADTVMEFEPVNGEGNGFVINDLTPEGIVQTMRRALTIFADKNRWMKLVSDAAAENFSWENSAERYVELYEEILTEGGV